MLISLTLRPSLFQRVLATSQKPPFLSLHYYSNPLKLLTLYIFPAALTFMFLPFLFVPFIVVLFAFMRCTLNIFFPLKHPYPTLNVNTSVNVCLVYLFMRLFHRLFDFSICFGLPGRRNGLNKIIVCVTI